MFTLTMAFSVALALSVPGDVEWFEGGYNAAIKQARAEQKQVLVAFVPEWSDYSKRMLAESLVDDQVASVLAGMVCLKYVEEDTRTAQVARLYNVTQFPTVVVATPKGKIEDVIIGFFPPGPLLSELQRIQSGTNTLSDHRARVEAAPDDLAVRYAYAVKLDEVGDQRTYQKELTTIRDADPLGATLTGCRLRIQDAWNAAAAAAPGGETSYDLTPIHALMEEVTLPQGRFEGWGQLARFERERERRIEAVAAFRRAWDDVTEAQRLDFANEAANYVLQADQGDLAPEAGAFALELAEDIAEGAVALEGQEVPFDYEPWLAEQLQLLARCQARYGPDGTAAIATAKRCVALDPLNPDYKTLLALLEAR